jgi:hypothetical protein
MLALQPGEHRVYAVKDGYAPRDLNQKLEPGVQSTWRLELVAQPGTESKPVAAATEEVAAKTPAPQTPPEPTIDVGILHDASAPLERKKAVLTALAGRNLADLTEIIQQVEPLHQRQELCLQYLDRVRKFRVIATGIDAFDDRLTGKLLVGETEYGKLPFDGDLPRCVDSVTATSTASPKAVTLSVAAPDDAKKKVLLEFHFPTRQIRYVVSAEGSVGVFTRDMPALTQLDVPSPAVFSGGVRFDVWGKVFHGSLSFRASTMYRRAFFGDDAAATPVAPSIDAFLGVSVASEPAAAMIRASLDVGIWDFVCPTARLTFAISFGELFFITLTGDAHYLTPALIVDPQQEFDRLVTLPTDRFFFGGSIGLGFGW